MENCTNEYLVRITQAQNARALGRSKKNQYQGCRPNLPICTIYNSGTNVFYFQHSVNGKDPFCRVLVPCEGIKGFMVGKEMFMPGFVLCGHFEGKAILEFGCREKYRYIRIDSRLQFYGFFSDEKDDSVESDLEDCSPGIVSSLANSIFGKDHFHNLQKEIDSEQLLKMLCRW